MNKKRFIPVILILMIVISACGNNAANNNNAAPSESAPSESVSASPSASTSAPASEEASTIVYESETGMVEVPANPTRIVALSNAPNVLSLGGTLVGVDQWTGANPLFTDKLAGIEIVSEETLEKIAAQEPDLIICGTEVKNLAELSKIAPTVAFTWGKLDYLAQQVAIGKLLNKEAEAQAWVDDFKQRAEAIGKEVKAKHGENVTVSVIETDGKSFWVYGKNWARGTEILHQAMSLSMPEKVKADALGPGYYTLSQEVLADYAGDFLILVRSKAGDNAFMENETWKNIPAVKNNHVIEIESEASSYSDPTTLEYLLAIFKTGFLG